MSVVDQDQQLAEGLIALGIAVDRVRHTVSRKLDLTSQQAQLVCALGHGGRSTSQLAALLGCDKANITGMVDRLERRAFVKRTRHTRDRRIVSIELTSEGHDIVEAFRSQAAAAFTARLTGLTASERDALDRTTRHTVSFLGPDLLEATQ